MQTISWTSLSQDEQNLLLSAEHAMALSYSPYSHFRVGAAILTPSNTIITAANVENASYGLCICAERSAIVKAYSMDLRDFALLAVIATNHEGTYQDIVAPCGACRQMLYEASVVCGHDIPLILANSSKTRFIRSSAHALLPLAFTL